jgi:WhiB family redox-sensing transcriptional regulator
VHTIVRTAPHSYGAIAPAAPERPRPACASEDPELFFPIGETGLALLQVEEAKVVCRRCPLIESCLQGALERNELGVWGGTDDAERRRIKRRRAALRRSAA